MQDFIELKGPIATKTIEELKDTEIKAHKKPTRWILVADQGKALIFKVTDQQLETLGEAYPETPYIKEQSNDFIGRDTPRAGLGRYGKEPPHESEEHEEKLFIKELSEFLDRASQKKAFREMVICADDRTLGMIRHQLSKNLQDSVVGELHKDLVNMPVPKIEEVLEHNQFL